VVQSTATPRTKTSASEASNRDAPPSSRRSVPVTTGPSPRSSSSPAFSADAASTVSVTAVVSTGCGDVSTNTPWPSRARVVTACEKRTVARRLSYQ
jgi:hypothetical protein